MSFLVQKYRTALRVFSAIINIDSRELSISQKYAFETAVYGYDNKNTRYKHRIYPKWSYGDDACFIAKNDDTYVLGVADGVGGWRSYGINPSQFSRAFMKICEKTVKDKRCKTGSPLELAKFSLYDIMNEKNPIVGSATFCILSLCRVSGTMYTANLGDSGYLVIRNQQLVAQSLQQKHSFNTPFQIALLPHFSSTESRFHKDNPDDAHQSSFKMQEGDVVVLGTDGLFENLPVSVIVKEVAFVQAQSTEINKALLQECAQKLVDQAHENALLPDFISPFACEARSHGINFKGGNPGDITVLLGYVVLESEEVISSESERHRSSSTTSSASSSQDESSTISAINTSTNIPSSQYLYQQSSSSSQSTSRKCSLQ